MTVELTASSELAQAIGEEQFAEYLAMFNARIVGTRPGDPIGAWIIYTLDVPDAPAEAASVIPLYGTHYDGPKRTPFLGALDWYDANGQHLCTENRPWPPHAAPVVGEQPHA